MLTEIIKNFEPTDKGFGVLKGKTVEAFWARPSQRPIRIHAVTSEDLVYTFEANHCNDSVGWFEPPQGAEHLQYMRVLEVNALRPEKLDSSMCNFGRLQSYRYALLTDAGSCVIEMRVGSTYCCGGDVEHIKTCALTPINDEEGDNQ